ncbi:uncharacterized protein LOC130993286 [Salvia miltiorrhiza]|uniref:uncharacterized protein LOC130993286 n=1 Tax=Salvia miltiorrhiza TaxID=226208 RepID=UPI0025ABAF62|nr:uncharacterized protein LOC130993286 [Salvia miltiorrhiza]
MDFHSLPRRELQAFCKKNKIPANMTNAAMADALKALEIVEGIEEFMQLSQSESAQSSIELPDGSEVTSPYVPPTGGRSTRRRNVVKDDVEALTSIMTTTRRTTRRTAAKASNESQVDAMETPAVVAQASRRKVQMASACLKMDSQLKECVEEQKKDSLMTPAAVGVASRRRRAEETEKKMYSTRRSVRLAVKSVQMSNSVKSEGSELSNNELFAKDCEDQEVNQKESLEDRNEISGIPGVDAIENVDENKEESEVVSAEKEDMTMGGTELGSTREEETSTDFAVEVQSEEICDNTEYPGEEDAIVPVNVSDEVQQSEGPFDVPTCEIEVTVESSKEVNTEIGDVPTCEVEVTVENSKEVNIEIDEAGDFESKVDEQGLNVSLGKLTLQQEVDSDNLGIPESEKRGEEEGVANSPSKQPPSGVPLHEASVEIGNKASMTGFSDNKENIELVIPQKIMKRSLEEESLRKLTKMLKKKLQISSECSKQGNNEALPRSALQVLPENGNGK